MKHLARPLWSGHFCDNCNVALKLTVSVFRRPIMLTTTDIRFLKLAYDEAKAGFDEGGCPIGSVLARGEQLVSKGRNQRVQGGDPIAHGEMDALRKAGRQKTYRDTTLYTSLSPCMMCTGTIIQFGIPRVVIGENTTFGGNEDFLRSRGVEVVIANDSDCIALMTRFIKEKPDLWAEDIAED
jgi:cytosine/creatinine deaminase